MTCHEVRDWMSAEMDGEARGNEQTLVDRHLAGCADCCRARAAAVALRQRLSSAAWKGSNDGSQDEAVLALLRREGRSGRPDCRIESRLGAVLHLFIRGSTRSGLSSVQPALAAMALSFLLTWSALKWAERRPADWSSHRPPSHGLAANRLRRTELVAKWLAGPPTLAALARLERSYPSKPMSPNTRRSAVPRLRRRIG
jgi:hypothetical protein